MSKLARYIITIGIAGVLCNIILMLWKMAEVKLYGWSQDSYIDNLAAGTIAYAIADLLMGDEE